MGDLAKVDKQNQTKMQVAKEYVIRSATLLMWVKKEVVLEARRWNLHQPMNASERQNDWYWDGTAYVVQRSQTTKMLNIGTIIQENAMQYANGLGIDV